MSSVTTETRDTNMLNRMKRPPSVDALTSVKVALALFPPGTRTKRKTGPEEASTQGRCVLARTAAAGVCRTATAAEEDMDTVVSRPLSPRRGRHPSKMALLSFVLIFLHESEKLSTSHSEILH